MAGLLPRHSIAEGSGKSLENGRFHQEILDVPELPLKHFPNQIVHHIAIVSGKGCDKAGRILQMLHRQRGHLQTGDPAFGALVKSYNLLGPQVKIHPMF